MVRNIHIYVNQYVIYLTYWKGSVNWIKKCMRLLWQCHIGIMHLNDKPCSILRQNTQNQNIFPYKHVLASRMKKVLKYFILDQNKTVYAFIVCLCRKITFSVRIIIILYLQYDCCVTNARRNTYDNKFLYEQRYSING